MGQKKYLNQIKIFCKALDKDFKTKKVILFGSRASGKPKKDSDIDLIIVSNDFKKMGFFDRVSKMYDYWTLEIPIDFLCYTESEFNNLKKKVSVVSEALKHGVTIK